MCLAISVLIIDDHRMFREGIRSRLEEEPDMLVVGEAASSEEALKMVKEKGPAVVIWTFDCKIRRELNSHAS